jgi:hypothetical protein
MIRYDQIDTYHNFVATFSKQQKQNEKRNSAFKRFLLYCQMAEFYRVLITAIEVIEYKVRHYLAIELRGSNNHNDPSVSDEDVRRKARHVMSDLYLHYIASDQKQNCNPGDAASFCYTFAGASAAREFANISKTMKDPHRTFIAFVLYNDDVENLFGSKQTCTINATSGTIPYRLCEDDFEYKGPENTITNWADFSSRSQWFMSHAMKSTKIMEMNDIQILDKYKDNLIMLVKSAIMHVFSDFLLNILKFSTPGVLWGSSKIQTLRELLTENHVAGKVFSVTLRTIETQIQTTLTLGSNSCTWIEDILKGLVRKTDHTNLSELLVFISQEKEWNRRGRGVPIHLFQDLNDFDSKVTIEQTMSDALFGKSDLETINYQASRLTFEDRETIDSQASRSTFDVSHPKTSNRSAPTGPSTPPPPSFRKKALLEVLQKSAEEVNKLNGKTGGQSRDASASVHRAGSGWRPH